MLTGCGVMTKFFDQQSSRCSILDLKATFMIEKCCGWEECHAAGVPGLLYKNTDDDDLPGKDTNPKMLSFENVGGEYFKYADAPMILSDEISYPVKTNIRKWKQVQWINSTSNRASVAIKDLISIDFGTENQLGHQMTETEEYEFEPPENEPAAWAAWTPYYVCLDGSLLFSLSLATGIQFSLLTS